MHAPDWPMANYFDSQYTQLFFSLSLQLNNFAHLLLLFGVVVFLMNGVCSCNAIAIHTWNYIHCHIYDRTKMIVDNQSVKL